MITAGKIDDDFIFRLKVTDCLIGSFSTCVQSTKTIFKKISRLRRSQQFGSTRNIQHTTPHNYACSSIPSICNMYNVKGFTGIYLTFATAILSTHLSKVARFSCFPFLSFKKLCTLHVKFGLFNICKVKNFLSAFVIK